MSVIKHLKSWLYHVFMRLGKAKVNNAKFVITIEQKTYYFLDQFCQWKKW